MKTPEAIEQLVDLVETLKAWEPEGEQSIRPAIEHAIQVMRESEWQPIEKIKYMDTDNNYYQIWLQPKDTKGTPYWSVRTVEYTCFAKGMDHFKEINQDNYYTREVASRVTHFRSLPRPPDE